MFAINNLSVHFGGDYLFRDMQVNINLTDRIGLTGRNGAGKTTLLRILAGEQEASSGEIIRPKESETGYLPQDIIMDSDRSVTKEVENAFPEVLLLQEKITKATEEMISREDYHSDSYMKLASDISEWNEQLILLDWYNIESNIEKVLRGLGFNRNELNQPVNSFSGGWRMRIMLAKLLLRSPELLLLDEPTNHLDIESIQWLEMYLKQYKGAIIMVSHDRAFLDSVTNRTIEIAHNGVFDMPVNYTKFIELRKREKELQQAAYENQQKEIKTKERFIERFKAKATKASQAQSRVKQLEKIERIQPEEELKAKIKFKFPEAPRSGKVAVEAKNIGKSFEDKQVFSGFDFIIARGERIAFVGKNGEGKTTLARIIAGELEHEGALKIGYNVHTGFYAQHRNESLDPKLTVFETIDRETTPDTQINVRSILGAFLFSNDDVYKKVSVLSGGEKARLSLAKLLLKPVNLLILDEPTNHLDMQSKEILKDALKDFSGTLIVVSHDRDFLKGLTDKVFEISKGKIYEYAGDVYEFIQKKQIEQLDQLNFEKQKSKTAESKKTDKADTSKLSYTERKESKKALKKLEKEVKQFENKIANKETEIEVLEKEMQSSHFNNMGSSDQQDYFDKYSKLREELSVLMEKWTKASEKLETQKKS